MPESPDTTVIEITLRARPGSTVDPGVFRTTRSPLRVLREQLDAGQLLVRTEALSLDPYVRARITDRASYKKPISLGDVIPGEAVATVIESHSPLFAPGDLVVATIGWRSHALIAGTAARALPAGLVDPAHALGALGMPGLTAYAGLLEYGRLKGGETLVVAAATGPVGSMVGQLARRRGIRVVGIASGAGKCRVLRDELGFDAAVDRHDRDLFGALRAACPRGIDVDFETAGGRIFESVLPLLNRHARVILCGLVAQWAPSDDNIPSARDLLRTTLDRSLTVSGFVVDDVSAKYRDSFLAEVAPLVADGIVVALDHRIAGVEQAPKAFIGMLAGRHTGKTLVVR